MQSHQFNSRHIMLKLVLCCFFLAVFSAPAFASTVNILSKKFEKPVGKPVTYTETFIVPAGVVECNILLNNGDDTRQTGQIFSVSVNGETIFDTKGLRVSNSAEKVILFQDVNTLEVSLTGQGGTSITIDIVGKVENRDDAIAPPPRVR
jgi:hypothetical protein